MVLTPGWHGDWSMGFGPWEVGCRGSQRPTVGEVRSEKVSQPLLSNALSIPLATAAPILLPPGCPDLALRHQRTAILIFLGQGTNACQGWGVLLGAQIQHLQILSLALLSCSGGLFGSRVALARTNQVRPLRSQASQKSSLVHGEPELTTEPASLPAPLVSWWLPVALSAHVSCGGCILPAPFVRWHGEPFGASHLPVLEIVSVPQ